MRSTYRLLMISIVLFGITYMPAKAQKLLSYELVTTLTTDQLDSLLNEFQPGANLLFQPEYDIDYYKVEYLSPYRHPDSLVVATGAIIVPKGSPCPLALASFSHGTISKREEVPSVGPFRTESLIGMILGSSGYLVTLPDYLGLGTSDSSIIIHPYITAFHQGHSVINLLRSARELSDSLSQPLNGQIFLGGYSQGGFSTVAAHRLIEEQYPNEFDITASAPMSGPYDLKEAQVDVILSDSIYSAPMYLPYIILGYQSVYGNLYDSIQQYFKAPYDSLLPALFYGGRVSSGTIDGLCEPIPKDMLEDSMVLQFTSDSTHPLRVALADNHMLDWAPQAPIKIHYCMGDEQVTYLNAIAAYDAWTANGSQNVEKEDFGNYGHVDCVLPSVINAKVYLDSYRLGCPASIHENKALQGLELYPNPTDDLVIVKVPDMAWTTPSEIRIYDVAGKEVGNVIPQGQLERINLSSLRPGMYFITLQSANQTYRSKLMVR